MAMFVPAMMPTSSTRIVLESPAPSPARRLAVVAVLTLRNRGWRRSGVRILGLWCVMSRTGVMGVWLNVTATNSLRRRFVSISMMCLGAA